MVGMRLSKNSTTETLEPMRANTEPNSIPITPPPTTIKCFGTSFNSNASVLEMILFLSKRANGSGVGFEPVAMMTFSVVNVVVFPSDEVTLIVFLSTKDPTPVCTSILFFFIRKAMPSTFAFTTPAFRLIIWVMLTFGSEISMPCSLNVWAAL